jgi:hypothetical protein
VCSLGFTMIVVRGAIFAPLREMAEGKGFSAGPIDMDLAKLLSCPMCFGTWAGLAFGVGFWAAGLSSAWIIAPVCFGTALFAPLLDPVRGWS